MTGKITNPRELIALVAEMNISVLSVDLFDTLVFRKCHKPDRVFAFQFSSIQELIPKVASQEDWVQLRKEAETEAASAAHPDEVHIDSIYERIGKRLSLETLTVSQIKQAELDTESKFISPFHDVIKAVGEIAAQGVEVAITTDIYLPAEFIRFILSRFLNYNVRLLCSSDTKLTKRSGRAFADLRRQFPGQKILHVGDNLHSDVTIARRSGVDALLVEWERSSWLRKNYQFHSYLGKMSANLFATPIDEPKHSSVSDARDEVAWRWSVVMLDFLASVRRYAKDVLADEIWFLSRDNEVTFAAIRGNEALFGEATVKYIYSSRAACYPIFALRDVGRFRQLTGREPTSVDMDTGLSSEMAYRSFVSKGTKRVLIVDAGWKGRLQIAIQSVLPHIEVFGFYFSMDDLAEKSIATTSRCFLQWHPACINQAAVEALFGFREQSCVGFYQGGDGKWKPQLRPFDSDRAPEDYCVRLRHYLTVLLQNPLADIETVDERRSAVRSTCIYPDAVLARAFQDWLIGSSIAGDNVVSLIDGGQATKLQRLLGKELNGNLWPAAASWGLTANPLLAWLIQFEIAARRSLLFRIKRQLRCLPKSAVSKLVVTPVGHQLTRRDV